MSVGTVVTAGSGAAYAQYKITSATEAQYLKSKLKKSAKSASIPATISVAGKTYAVTSVAKGALKGYKKVKSLVIGANVVKIGASAFQGCKKLAKVTVKSKKLKSIGKKAFKSTSSKIKVKVPKAKKAAYKKMLKKAGLPKKGKVK